MKKINALSLFANVGIAETYLSEIGIDVKIANEIDPKRVNFYKHLYPEVDVVTGDITNTDTKNTIVEKAKKQQIDLLMATPPCQGMSTAGKQDKNDTRNLLICDTVEIIKELLPKYVFLENVPEQLITKIFYNGEHILISDYLKKELGAHYIFNSTQNINAKYYGVAQDRERAIFLLVRNDLQVKWEFPQKEKILTLEEAIGNFPSLDPLVYDISPEEQSRLFPLYEEKRKKGLEFSKWHYPPKHVYRQVFSIMHTPTGQTAFNNIEKYKPKKQDGSFVKGFKNTYKRQSWDKPGYTVTMFNRTIGSQNNVHPGRYIGKNPDGENMFSDARVLTIRELMEISSLPASWNIPEWASDHFIRQVIGEGIPPLMVKKIMEVITNENK